MFSARVFVFDGAGVWIFFAPFSVHCFVVVVSHRCWMIKEKLVPWRLFSRTNRPYLIIRQNITPSIKSVCFLSSRAEPPPFETAAVARLICLHRLPVLLLLFLLVSLQFFAT